MSKLRKTLSWDPEVKDLNIGKKIEIFRLVCEGKIQSNRLYSSIVPVGNSRTDASKTT